MYKKSVYLYVTELLHDIDGELQKFSKLLGLEGEVREEVQSDESTEPMMMRKIEQAVGSLESLMQAYVVDVDKKVVDNRQFDVDEYLFSLSFPENWLTSGFRGLASDMHNYIVSWCVGDYLKSSFPNQASVYEVRAEEYKWSVKHRITARVSNSLKMGRNMF